MSIRFSLLLHSLMLVKAVPAQSADTNQLSSVQGALSQMAGNLINYAKQGKITPVNGDGPEAFQWFEGGLYYGIMMDYTKITQDNQYSTILVNSLTQESFGKTGSFLGTDPSTAELGGKVGL